MKPACSVTTTCIPRIIAFSILMVLQGPAAVSGAAQTKISLQPFAQHVR